MKKMSLIFVLVPLLVLVSDCSSKTTNSDSLNNVNQLEQVTLTFVQHTFSRFSYDENDGIDGYYFLNDELAKTSI